MSEEDRDIGDNKGGCGMISNDEIRANQAANYNPDDYEDGRPKDWRLGSDSFSARYYLIDLVIRKWGAVDEARDIMTQALKEIRRRRQNETASL